VSETPASDWVDQLVPRRLAGGWQAAVIWVDTTGGKERQWWSSTLFQSHSLRAGGPPILQYVNFGALNPPHDYMLYTPQFRDRLYLNVIYRAAAFSDVEAELLRPMRTAIGAMAEAFSAAR